MNVYIYDWDSKIEIKQLNAILDFACLLLCFLKRKMKTNCLTRLPANKM